MRLPWKIAGGLSIGYVVLELVSVSLGTKVPELGAPSAEVVSDFTAGAAARMYAGTYVTGLALLVFAAVAAFLARATRDAAGSGWAAGTAYAAAVVYVTMAGLDATLLAALVHGGHHGVDAGALVLVNDARNFALDAGFLALGAFTVMVSVALRRAGALPSWIAYSGMASGALLFLPMAFGPAFLLNLVWVIALGIVMASRPAAPADAETTGRPAVPVGV